MRCNSAPLDLRSGAASPNAATRRGPFGGHRYGRRGPPTHIKCYGRGSARHALQTVLPASCVTLTAHTFINA